MSQLVDEFLVAVNALHNSPDNTLRSRADQWLQAFQNKSEAWAVADRVLHQQRLGEHVYYMAANTLRAKLQSSFSELPDASARLSFRQSLLQHISNFARGPQLIRTRLALCFADLCVHLGGSLEWPYVAALETLTKLFFVPEYSIMVLDILTVLPEECANKKLRVSSTVRQVASQTLAQHTPAILQMLLTLLDSTNDRSLQKKSFQCVLSWVKHGGVTTPGNALFTAMFEALRVPELFSVACDVIVQLIQISEEMDNNNALVGFLVPRVLQLLPLLDQSIQAGLEERVANLAQVFTQLGESYINIVIEGSPQGMEIVKAVLRCSALTNKELASNTFHFWYLLSDEVNLARTYPRLTPEQKASAAPPRMGLDKVPLFLPYFSHMVELVRQVMRFPLDCDVLRPDQKDDAKRYRYVAAEALLDLSAVLSPAVCLQQIYSLLQKECVAFEQDHSVWHGLEACMYCLRSIARRVDASENVVIPQMMRLLPQFSNNPHLRYTATLIVGRYSEWINQHPSDLAPLLQFVVAGLNDPLVASSAALAFKHMCDGCNSRLHSSTYLPALFGVYDTSTVLLPQDQKEVIEGVASVVAALPPEKVPEAVQRMVLPLAERIQAVVKMVPLPEEVLLSQLTRLAEVFRFLECASSPHDTAPVASALVALYKQLWGLLQGLTDMFENDEQKIQRVCRVWKYAVKSARLQFEPLLAPLLQLLCAKFEKTKQSAFMYTLSVCVDQFGGVKSAQPVLASTFELCIKQSLSMLVTPQDFVQHPDITQDFFEISSRYLRRCPKIFFGSPLIPHILQCGVRGLDLEHQEASVALLQFFGLLITEGINNGKVNARRGRPPDPAVVQALQALLQQIGSPLTEGLMRGVAGKVPVQRVKLLLSIIEALLAFNRQVAHSWIAHALGPLPDTTNPTKKEFLEQLVQASDAMTVREAFSDWAKQVRRTRTDVP